MNATMHDVARVAGVSIKTVSNVINDYPHVRATTRDRVLVAIKELGYQPNLSARGLRSGKTGVIGLAIPSVREAYFAELADSIIVAAEKRGLGVVVDQTNQVREHELDVVAGRRLRLTDGIVFSPVTIAEGGCRPAQRAVPAGDPRREHLRRADRPRHDAQRVLGPGGDRAPSGHRPAADRA